MQKKYNLHARLQCAEEENDDEWWERGSGAAEPAIEAVASKFGRLWLVCSCKIRHPAAGQPVAGESDAAPGSQLAWPSVRALPETLAAHCRQI